MYAGIVATSKARSMSSCLDCGVNVRFYCRSGSRSGSYLTEEFPKFLALCETRERLSRFGDSYGSKYVGEIL
jgi:hypothetical protein